MNVEQIAKGLTNAQRHMVITGDDTQATVEEYRELFALNIMGRNGKFQLSSIGQSLRAYLLQSQTL